MPACWWAKNVLVGKELAAAAVSALDLVEDEDSAVGCTFFSQCLQECRVGHPDAAHALDAFDDDGADIALAQFGTHGFHVVQGQVGHVLVGIDGGDDFRIVRHLHGQGGASVEGFVEADEARPSVVEGGQLQRVLVGFGAAVDEEQLVVVVAARLAQAFGQLLLQLVDDRVGVEAQGGHLFADHLHVVRVGMADGDDGMAAIEVEVFSALFVPYVAAFAPHDVDVEQGIYVKEFHCLSS